MRRQIANDIIKEAAENGCAVIGLENLTSTRDCCSDVSWGNKWGFKRAYEYVAHKTKFHRIDVKQVDPEYTSRRCSHNRFAHPDDRDDEDFERLECGYENHTEYNPVRNRWMAVSAPESDYGWRRHTRSVRLNHGMMNANESTGLPPRIPAKAGVHAKVPSQRSKVVRPRKRSRVAHRVTSGT